MIGLFLITHSCYGESLIQCACHILNNRPLQLQQMGVSAQDEPTLLLPVAQDLLRLTNSGAGVLILTDLYGATPANIALKLLVPGSIEGVAGVNLPMLLRALTYRNHDLPTLLTRTLGGGRDGIINMLQH